MPSDNLVDWEEVLSSAARLQRILPEAVLVGGTAAALYAQHRVSRDADHVLPDLEKRFDEILAQLESVAGWKTARVQRPVLVLGSLDGIETGIRQLIREEPLETTEITWGGQCLRVPTVEEILRIKAVLILKRNATRDYVDFAALAAHLGPSGVISALRPFDRLYPQSSGESAIQQLQVQLATPLPFDLEKTDLTEYRNLKPPWQDWRNVQATCAETAAAIFDSLAEE